MSCFVVKARPFCVFARSSGDNNRDGGKVGRVEAAAVLTASYSTGASRTVRTGVRGWSTGRSVASRPVRTEVRGCVAG